MSHLSNERYGYFDALRGFSMLLVVFWHVMLFSIGSTDGINPFFCSFFLPLFFFISGFFAYKPLESWNRLNLVGGMVQKFKVQIIGASVFHLLFIMLIYMQLPDIRSLFEPNEYWFTYVLFGIFIGYMMIILLSILCRRSKAIFWLLLTIATSICIGIYACYYDFIKMISWSHTSEILFYQLFNRLAIYYFPYFAIGIFARAKISLFEKLLSNGTAKIIVMIAVVSIWTANSLGAPVPLEYSPLSYPFRLVTMLLVIQFFYSIRHEFDRDTLFSKTAGIIGRRTLDIYFIHYFFIPDLSFLNPYLSTENPVFLQLVSGIPTALIIVGLSLLVGQVIRMSPALAEWLLGAKSSSYVIQTKHTK